MLNTKIYSPTSPAEAVILLKAIMSRLYTYKKSTTDLEFNSLCRYDAFFITNLQLEIRDIFKTLQTLQELLGKIETNISFDRNIE